MSSPADRRDQVRAYWDLDSETYDLSESHAPSAPLTRVAWSTAVSDVLGEKPLRVLDVGAGTGFLSLIAAAMGHHVTAMDLSPRMLAVLAEKASSAGVEVEIVEGDATAPPVGPFDVVMSRHLLWTLPDPARAVAAWRSVAPQGRLVLFDSLWGEADRLERVRSRVGTLLAKARRSGSDHHAPYPEEVKAELPFGTGVQPADLIELVEQAGWSGLQIRRLRDIEWASALVKPPAERVLGAHPAYVLTARAGT